MTNSMLNEFVFADLEELEIVNTFIDYIESNVLLELTNLRVVRLENVRLKSIVKSYLSDFALGPFDYNDPSMSWLANEKIDEIFVGREHLNELGFKFENEFLCYFAGLSPKAKFYIYDAIDFNEGIECTCTLLWIYSLSNSFESLLHSSSPYSMYITKCIRKLGTKENVENELNKCLAENEIPATLEYCKSFGQTTKDSTIATTTIMDGTSPATSEISTTTTAAATTTTIMDETSQATSENSTTTTAATTTTTTTTTTKMNETSPATSDSFNSTNATMTTRNATTSTTKRTIATNGTNMTTTSTKANEQLERKIENLTKLFLGLGISFGTVLLVILLFLFIYFHRRFKSFEKDFIGMKYDKNIQMNSIPRNRNYKN